MFAITYEGMQAFGFLSSGNFCVTRVIVDCLDFFNTFVDQIEKSSLLHINIFLKTDLIVALKSKDRSALEYLYDHYAGALLGVVARILKKEELAEEVLQDVFLKVWDRIDSYDAGKGRLFTWMLNIARNQAIDKTRSKEFSKGKKTGDIDNYVNRIENEGFVEQKVEAIGLQNLLNTLPEDQRFIIDQHYLKGYTQAEIAEEFNLPLGTVKTRMRLAMKELRNLLKVRVNVEQYISSGILEAYVLGELPEQERLEVEKNLKLYPELRKELALIEETQEKLLMKAAISPKPSVKKSLFAKIDASETRAKVVQLPPAEGGIAFWKFAAAASVTVALITSYLAYDYRDKWKKTESNLAELTAQNQQMATDYNTVNQRLDQIENDLRVTNNPDFNRILLRGTPNAPGALASVYWNEKTKEVFLSIQDLKELAQENQYQLWAIIDGKPVDAGVFDSNFKGLLKMKDIGTGAATFAVTIEPRGGRQTPTLETMQVAGNVVKS